MCRSHKIEIVEMKINTRGGSNVLTVLIINRLDLSDCSECVSVKPQAATTLLVSQREPERINEMQP